MSSRSRPDAAVLKIPRRTLGTRIRLARNIYILFLPTLIFFIIFAYVPFYGIQIAFKDYQIFRGINASPWVGLQVIRDIFKYRIISRLVVNTLRISFFRILFGFPVPVIFALLLNEVRSRWYKRVVQTVTFFPHFLSWVVFAGIIFTYIGPSGIINSLIKGAGGEPINFTTSSSLFIPIIISTGILKEFGWGAIVYLAGLSGIDPQLYEAAGIDGASRLRQTWHVSLPGIRNVMALLLVISVAHVLDAGFEQIFMFLNPTVLDVGDIIDTYVYRVGLLGAKYEFGTAVGLLKGIVSLILIVSANYLIRKMGETSLW